MKTCTKCLSPKDESGFNREPGGVNGLKSYCKACQAISNKIYRDSNKEYFKEKGSLYYKANKAKRREDSARRHKENPSKRTIRRQNKGRSRQLIEYEAEWRKNNQERLKDWRLSNRGKMNASAAKRRAIKLRATPKWLSKEQLIEIEEFYTLAQELAWLNQDGKPFHVDHIMPLQGKESCGLHVPWNLQLLPAVENLKKSNKIRS